MKKSILWLGFLFLSSRLWGMDCPITIEGAQLYLSIDNETHLKIHSALSCGTKESLPQKFVDADVELWRKGERVGTFYSRRVTYSERTQMLVLNQALLQINTNNKLKESRQYVIDLKRHSITSQNQLAYF